MPLAGDIVAAVSVLTRGAQSVSAVMETGSGENRFTEALQSLQRLSEAHDVPIAIVGGLGAIRYGYPAATQDIDVAIGRNHLETLLRLAPAFGFKVAWQAESGWHTLLHGDVEINIVPEGGKAKKSSPTTIPGPPELGVPYGLGYASLESWIELKISSGRQKDRAHVVEVLKKSDAESIRIVREHLGTVHLTYLKSFNDLLEEARSEQNQENERA